MSCSEDVQAIHIHVRIDICISTFFSVKTCLCMYTNTQHVYTPEIIHACRNAKIHVCIYENLYS